MEETYTIVYRGLVPHPKFHIADADSKPICGTVLVATQAKRGSIADVTCPRCLAKRGK